MKRPHISFTWISAFVAIIPLALGLACSSPAPEVGAADAQSGPIELGDGVIAEIASVRTWTEYDGRKPESENQMFWGFPGTTYGMDVKPFAPVEGIEHVSPEGIFVELVIRIKTGADEKQVTTFIGPGESMIRCTLTPEGGQPLQPTAFYVPAGSLSETTLIIGWEGGLHTELHDGEETWMLLVFDLPTGAGTAAMQLLDAKTRTITIPPPAS